MLLEPKNFSETRLARYSKTARSPLATSDMQSILIKLRRSFRWFLPRHTILGELLHGGFQFRLHERKVIDTTQAQDAHPRECGAHAIHKRATRVTEVIGHSVILSGLFEENGL